jgi:hypothetical protein
MQYTSLRSSPAPKAELQKLPAVIKLLLTKNNAQTIRS